MTERLKVYTGLLELSYIAVLLKDEVKVLGFREVEIEYWQESKMYLTDTIIDIKHDDWEELRQDWGLNDR